jgi:hypothetical protein
MQPWRAETFDLLKRASSDATERWPGYAAFAALQEKGLRQQALAAARAFAEDMKSRGHESRWDFVSWLFRLMDASGHVVLEALVPFPLKVDVVLPTLRESRAAAEPRPEAFLWMSQHYTNDINTEHPEDADPRGAMLRDGIRRTDSDVRLKRALAMHLVGIVEYNQHHLFESSYLDDPAADLQYLAEARQLVGESTDEISADINRAEELVRAWQAYRAAGGSDFVAWCRDHGVRPPGGAAYYYDR